MKWEHICLLLLGMKYTEVGLTEARSVWSTEVAHIWVPGPPLPPPACSALPLPVLRLLLLLLEKQGEHEILLNLFVKQLI